MRRRLSLQPLDVLPAVLAVVLLGPIVANYWPPVQHRDFRPMGEGSADFRNYYAASLAFANGLDPYADASDRQYYLPGHYVAFAPLARIYGRDHEGAAQAWFAIQLLLLSMLAGVVAMGSNREARPLVFSLGLVLFGLHLGARLGLERGQSDTLQALLSWSGILLATRGQLALAVFLLVAGASMKGYGALLVAGLALAHIGRRSFWSVLAGVLAALAPLLALTGPLAWRGLRASLDRAKFLTDDKQQSFSYTWLSHGFKRVGWDLAPDNAEGIRMVLTGLALLVTVLAWRRYREALDRPEEGTRLVTASLASLTTMIGFSETSYAYNMIFILPGLLSAAVLAHRAAGVPRPPSGSRVDAADVLLCFAFVLAAAYVPSRLAPAPYGLIFLLAWCFLVSRRAVTSAANGPGRAEATAT